MVAFWMLGSGGMGTVGRPRRYDIREDEGDDKLNNAPTTTTTSQGISETLGAASAASPSPAPASAAAPDVYAIDITLTSNDNLVKLNQTAGFAWNLLDNAATETARNNHSLVLFLCQTNATGPTSVDSANSWSVAQLLCQNSFFCSSNDDFIPGAGGSSYVFNTLSDTSLELETGFFLCFATGMPNPSNSNYSVPVCNSYSGFFRVVPEDFKNISKRQFTSDTSAATSFANPAVAPTTSITLTQATTLFSYPGMPTSSLAGITSTISTSLVTVTSSNATTASTAAATSNSNASAPNSGLSTGAKIGIALGAFAGILTILLLALFFLRRKHSKRKQSSSQHEEVMLTRNMHTDSFGPTGIMSEKEDPNASNRNITLHSTPATNLSIDNESNIASIPAQCRSALSPYEDAPSAPYRGTAASIPRANPTKTPIATAASAVSKSKPTVSSAISRGLSQISRISRKSSSGRTPISPRSLNAQTPASEYESYHDVPVTYGDARRSAQVFDAHSHDNSVSDEGIHSASGEEGHSATAPFLRDEDVDGMTVEEVARLEEEERRIDAAIAEAERSEGQGR